MQQFIQWLVTNKVLVTTIVALFSVILGLAGAVIRLRSQMKDTRREKLTTLFRQYCLNHKEFVDRIDEVQDILDLLSRSPKVINLFGEKGVGKSEVLKLVCDFINNPKIIPDRQRRKLFQKKLKTEKYKAIYFDVSDSTGIEDIKSEIAQVSFPEQKLTFEGWIAKLGSIVKQKKVVVVFDNMNNPGLASGLARLIEHYCTFRNRDTFLIGSIHETLLYSLPIIPVELFRLPKEHILEYGTKKGRQLHSSDLEDLFRLSEGLPIYLDVILNRGAAGLDELLIQNSIAEFIYHEVIEKLDSELNDLLKACSFLCIAKTELTTEHLSFLEIDSLDKKLLQLSAYSLVIKKDRNCTRFKIHDRIRDLVIDRYFHQSKNLNSKFAARYQSLDRNLEAVIHYLMSDSLKDNDSFVGEIIEGEERFHNYSFLIACGRVFDKTNQSQIGEHLLRRILKGYVFGLMGVGDYDEAFEVLNRVDFNLFGISPINTLSDVSDFDFHFLAADLDHLQNRYDESISLFLLLAQQCAAIPELRDQEAKCLGMVAHSLRHQGKDLSRCLDFYQQSKSAAKVTGDLRTEIRALNGFTCLNILIGNSNFDFEKSFTEAQTLADLGGQATTDVLLSSRKLKSVYLRVNDRAAEAVDVIEEVYNDYSKAGSRLVCNAKFEWAEVLRSLREGDRALEMFQEVIDFAEKNGDKNILSHALLGASISLSDKKQLEEALSNLNRSEEIALSSDIHITRLQCQVARHVITKGEIPDGDTMIFHRLKQIGLNREIIAMKEMNLEKMALILL